MGSTFGKVRKYNVNQSGDPSAYRNNGEFVVDGKPFDFSQSAGKEGLKNFIKETDQRPRYYNPKTKESDPSVPLFSTTYVPPSQTEQFGLGITEDLLISQNSYSHAKKDPIRRSYEFSEQELQSAIENILRTSTFRSTGVADKFGSMKPDTAIDPNPKPHQKVYSTEDIHKILKPLNMLNSKVKPIQSYQSFLDQKSYQRPEHSFNISQTYSISHKCCNHHVIPAVSQSIEVMNQPPPYSDTSTGQKKQATQASCSSLPSQHFSLEGFQHIDRPKSNHPIFTPNTKYNTIHNDGRIPLHLRKEFKTFSKSGKSPSSPVLGKRINHQQLISSDKIKDFTTNLQRSTQSSDKNQYNDIQQFNRSHILRRTAFFDQSRNVDTHLHDSTLSRTNYTIPEGTSWPPPFGYNSMQSASYRPHY